MVILGGLVLFCFYLKHQSSKTWKTLERNKSVPGLEVPLTVLQNTRASGFKAFRWGHHYHAQAIVDQLPETNHFWIAVNHHLKTLGAGQVADFCPSMSLQSLWNAIQNRAIPINYDLTTKWEIQLATPQIVSVLNWITDYTGGAHGGMEIQTWNALRTDLGWRELTLSELFKTNSNWQPELAKQVTKSLNLERRNRLFDTEAPLGEFEEIVILAEDLEQRSFTLGPEGIQFWYAPYEVGSWAEGSYEPIVPYLEINSLLDEQGPTKGLPRSR